MKSADNIPERDFFITEDVVGLSRRLLGMKLISASEKGRCAGIITETEAYLGETDRASHAYGGRRTARTEVMYREGGVAYVYLCYGIHSLLNVVAGPGNKPYAILIRGLYLLQGLDVMAERSQRKKEIDVLKDGIGPGKLTKAMGIDLSHNGIELFRPGRLWLEETGLTFNGGMVKIGPRVGVEYAGEDALLPYRFLVDNKTAAIEIKKAGLV